MRFRFPVIVVDKDLRSGSISGSGICALTQAIEQEGTEVTGFTSYGNLTLLAQQSSHASTFIASIDDDEFINSGNDRLELEAVENLRAFVAEVRRRNADTSISPYGEAHTSCHLPNDALRELCGFIYMFEDTSELAVRHITREARNYPDSLLPPFLKMLTDYAQGNSYLWYCPGHSGGVTFPKNPVGQVFHQFSGKNILRTDVYNAAEELDQLLDHTGLVAASKRNAVRIFGPDYMSFVTNDMSTSSRMAQHVSVAPGDTVVVGRNCHKSNLHAIMMMGVIPVLLTPAYNHLGIVGPILGSESEPKTIAGKIIDYPFASKIGNKKSRILTITRGTYDGALYSAEMIKGMLSTEIDTPYLDGAWLPHTSLHPPYKDMHAIGCGRSRSGDTLVYAMQSTYKLLASLPQIPQIFMQDSETHKLDAYRSDEAYLMYMSTNPQYPVIALCDIAAMVMEAPGGTALMEESIVEALGFRRIIRKVEHEHPGTNGGNGRSGNWWFKVWGPNDLSDEGVEECEAWTFKANERWHDFGNLAEDFNLPDPVKTAVIIPDLNVDDKFSDSGILVVIITCYLAERGTTVEKVGLYSFFIMSTISTTKDRWNSLVTELRQFKDDCDNDQPLWRVLPESVCQYPQYERTGLRELCSSIHSVYQANGVARVTAEVYLPDMEPAMIPLDAQVKMAHRETERVAIGNLEGCITGILLTPYPLGIPLLTPGERFNRTVVQYLQFARGFNRLFPGLGTGTHGLVEKEVDGRMEYLVDCVCWVSVA